MTENKFCLIGRDSNSKMWPHNRGILTILHQWGDVSTSKIPPNACMIVSMLVFKYLNRLDSVISTHPIKRTIFSVPAENISFKVIKLRTSKQQPMITLLLFLIYAMSITFTLRYSDEIIIRCLFSQQTKKNYRIELCVQRPAN